MFQSTHSFRPKVGIINRKFPFVPHLDLFFNSGRDDGKIVGMHHFFEKIGRFAMGFGRCRVIYLEKISQSDDGQAEV